MSYNNLIKTSIIRILYIILYTNMDTNNEINIKYFSKNQILYYVNSFLNYR